MKTEIKYLIPAVVAVIIVIICCNISHNIESHNDFKPKTQDASKTEQATARKKNCLSINEGRMTRRAIDEEMEKILEPEIQDLYESLKSQLNADSPEDRIEGLEQFYESDSAPEQLAIYFLKNDPDPTVRTEAAFLLEPYDESKEAVAALVYALTDNDEEVRESALFSVKAIRNSYVQSELKLYLKDNRFDLAMKNEAKLLLDRYFLRFDPFSNPLKN